MRILRFVQTDLKDCENFSDFEKLFINYQKPNFQHGITDLKLPF